MKEIMTAIVIALVLLNILVISVVRDCVHQFKQEAIKHHAAYWLVNQDGSTTFKWNDEGTAK